MNQIAKKFLCKPAFELEYGNDREPMYTYHRVSGAIEMAFYLGQITRRERVELDQINDQLYEQNKYSSAAYDI